MSLNYVPLMEFLMRNIRIRCISLQLSSKCLLLRYLVALVIQEDLSSGVTVIMALKSQVFLR